MLFLLKISLNGNGTRNRGGGPAKTCTQRASSSQMAMCDWLLVLICHMYIIVFVLEISSQTEVPITNVGEQIMTYQEEADDSRTVVIKSPVDYGLAETTLLMNTKMILVCCQPQFNLYLT